MAADDIDAENIADRFLLIEEQLARELIKLDYGCNVKYVYNPLDYAKEVHSSFVKKFVTTKPKKVLFLGMNPGPWGMCQTGVPFGEVQKVKSWLKIEGNIRSPEKEHPKRKIEGLSCLRREVSGERFWSLFEDLCDEPETFAKNCVVYNYCPLAFLGESGKNVTPVDMKKDIRTKLNDLCDKALMDMIELLETSVIIGIGRFAETRANAVLKENGRQNGISVHFMTHPSPASPMANQGWSGLAKKQLEAIGVLGDIVPHTSSAVLSVEEVSIRFPSMLSHSVTLHS